jgi:hypothetical protein
MNPCIGASRSVSEGERLNSEDSSRRSLLMKYKIDLPTVILY